MGPSSGPEAWNKALGIAPSEVFRTAASKSGE